VKKDDALRAGIEHFGLDEILTLADETRSGKALAAADARVLVDEALDQITARSRARAADQAASLLHEKFRAEAAATADESLAREFKHLGPLDTERLRRFADLLARKLAHDPAKGLKRLAATHGREATEHFLDEDPRRER
jgi:glutamyl-tRNA reductase